MLQDVGVVRRFECKRSLQSNPTYFMIVVQRVLFLILFLSLKPISPVDLLLQ